MSSIQTFICPYYGFFYFEDNKRDKVQNLDYFYLRREDKTRDDETKMYKYYFRARRYDPFPLNVDI